MKTKPFFFTKRFPISSLFPFSPQRCFPFSTRNSVDDAVSGCSAVYSHALKFQRPATIWWSPRLENTASFIGSITREPTRVNSKTGDFGVYTLLNVRRSNQPDSSFFRVFLIMWNGVAELASEHLKPNDFIYVSGSLASHTKLDATGSFRLNYKLEVKEFEFVAQRPDYQGYKKLESVEGAKQTSQVIKTENKCLNVHCKAEAGMQSKQNQLYLWQVFFANPNEWWDQRKRKFKPTQPDFKHKATGEVLWLSKYDPPWVKKQLQLLDSRIAGGGSVGRRSRVTTWVYDE